MLPIFTAYPQFAPNQILTSNNLNQLYDYLHEQERLTRTHLIGIGIVCGLEASLNDEGDQLTISRGCGVTSAGHLIIWDEDEPLEFRRPYTMPEDIDYPFFDLPDQSGNTYPLWELTTDRDDDGEAVDLTGDFLAGIDQDEDAGEGDEKVLLLLFECRAMDNSNCTPTSCDDKGRTVETAVRPLLIRRGDLEEIRRVLALDHPGVEAYYALSQSHAERLALPTLRGPRFNVPNTSPVTSRQLLETYQTTLSATQLSRVQTALDEAYTTLAPLLPDYPANPFAGTITGMTFLHDGSLFNSQAGLMIQYYYDHLMTLVHAYDELRARAEELFSLCCPDAAIFPRHLVLHTFTDDGITNAMRHDWVSSPVQNRQAEARRGLQLLFARLVSLTRNAELPTDEDSSGPPVQGIRITPSFLGKPLSQKAIPYYYDPGELVEQWSPALTAVGRSGENLGFRASQWNGLDDFVVNPLIYDLEPRKFLRIEGAIGQDYRAAVQNIRQQIDTFCLPIDVVALRTGGLTAGLQIEDYALHFGDLQSQYVVVRERMLGRLAEVLVRIYDTKMLDGQGNPQPLGFRGQPNAPLLRRLTGYQYLRGSVGEFYEDHYNQHTEAAPYTVGFDFAYVAHLFLIHAMVGAERRFTPLLRDLPFADVNTRLSTFLNSSRFTSRLVALGLNDAQVGSPATSLKVDLEELSDQLDELMTSGDLDALRALYGEYEARRESVLERQLFATFQREHPGLQFKAGTELGGTFVLVYHGPDGDTRPPRQGSFRLLGRVLNDGQPVPGVRVSVVGSNLIASTRAKGEFNLTVNNMPVRLRVDVPGAISETFLIEDEEQFLELELGRGADRAPISDFTAFRPAAARVSVQGVTIGTVIADFYLPYRCCGGGLPIQVIPPLPPEEPTETLTASVRQVGCTRSMRTSIIADVEFTVSGGTPPYFLEDENGNRQALPEGPQELFGDFSGAVVDSATGRVELSIALRGVVTITLIGDPICTDDNQLYTREFEVSGGQPPYTYLQPDGSQETVGEGTIAMVRGIASGQGFTLVVTDDSESECSEQIAIGPHTCTVDEPGCELPCDGIATRAGYPLWLQRPNNESTEYREVEFVVNSLELTDETGNVISLTPNDLGPVNADVQNIIGGQNSILTLANFVDVNRQIVSRIAAAIDEEINTPLNLPNSEQGLILNFVDDESFDRLNVEIFDCFSWNMAITLNYRESVRGRDTGIPRERSLSYSTDEMTVVSTIVLDNQTNESTATTRNFDRFRIDRCDPNGVEVARCTTQVPGVSIRADGRGQGRRLSIVGNPRNLPTYWEVGFGIPSVSNESLFSAGFIGGDLQAGVRVLIVDSATGCFTVAGTRVAT